MNHEQKPGDPNSGSMNRDRLRTSSHPASWSPTVWLAALAALFLYPFLWMLTGVFKTNLELFRPLQFWPEAWNWEPAKHLLRGDWFPFWTVFLNSLIAASAQAAGSVALASLAGYVFARHRLRGQRFLFMLAVAGVALPPQAMAVSLFSWLNQLGLIDHLAGVALPGMISGLAILYFTQVYRQLPGELIDMARVEGASEFRVYWAMIPLVRTSLLSFGLIQFILAWHQHLIPLLILSSAENQTLPLALAALYGSSLRFPYAVLMAGSVIAVLPTAILFGLFYRRLRSSLADLLLH